MTTINGASFILCLNFPDSSMPNFSFLYCDVKIIMHHFSLMCLLEETALRNNHFPLVNANESF